MRVVQVRKLGSRNSTAPVLVTWENGKKVSKEYAFIRGAAIWPRGDLSGFALVAGKDVDTNQVQIFEEMEFKGLAEAVTAFGGFWVYRPSIYYFNDVPENDGFIKHLRRDSSLSGKLPFIAAPNLEGLDYGISLIERYLAEGNLIVPPEGMLAKQLQGARRDLDPEQYYAVTALRYLLQGIDDRPWPFEVIDWDFSRCGE